MEIVRTPKGRPKQIAHQEISSSQEHDVTLYDKPPDTELSLQDYEDFILERVQVLQTMKNISEKGVLFLSQEWKQELKQGLVEKKLYDFEKTIFYPTRVASQQSFLRRKKDIYSHWLLLSAFCNTHDKAQWLLSAESELFKLRISGLSESSLKEFIVANQLLYVPLTAAEKSEMRSLLTESSNAMTFERTEYYKVKYSEVPDLVSDVNVVLKNGFAYVPLKDFGSIALYLFKNTMRRKLEIAKKHYENFQDPRTERLINNLHPRTAIKQYSGCEGVSLKDIDTVAKTSFPLCARTLYDALKQENHLKYQGRQQLQLFLKGIGVSVDDAITLFRNAFLRKMDSNKFEKEYVYAIKHNYGEAGSRKNYKPMSCATIINLPAGHNEKHGCPFKTNNLAKLQKQLKCDGINAIGQNEILELSRTGHVQLACSKYFSYKHNGILASINHPNEYFEQSRSFYGDSNSDDQKSNSRFTKK